MYLLILALPLASSFISGFFGRKLGEKGAGFFSSSCILLTFLLCAFAQYEIAFNNGQTTLHIINWMDIGFFTVSFSLCFDQITAIMLVVITSISSLVHIYSLEYMNGDPHLPRFMSYLSLFTFFMVILVTSNNILQLFVGWEGIGVASYLLIGFWYTRLQAGKAAIQAVIVNRIGDAALALAMFLLFYTFKSLDFSIIFALVPYLINDTISIFSIEINTINFIGILLLIGCAGKSAQIGLHTWLPLSMEGPTPVSALLHAATLVTAGLYLIVRFSPLLEFSNIALISITIVGALTAFFAATAGLLQNDIKRVIAFSTCSQLGYMLFACGISNYNIGLFHLMNHAFFKALLFLSAGSIIHAMSDEQDVRKLGGLIKALPFTYSMMLIGSLSLLGFPFMTGFYSKDAILEIAYANYSTHATFAHWLGTLSAFFTAFYSTRLLYLVFLTDSKNTQNITLNSHEPSYFMTVPLFILAIGSIFIGYLYKEAFIGVGSDFFGNSIFIHQNNLNLIEAEFISSTIKWTPVIISLFGGISALTLYHLSPNVLLNVKTKLRFIYIFFNNKWHFDTIYNHFIIKPLVFWGYNVSYKILDRGLIEYIGPDGLTKLISKIAIFLSSLQAGYVYNYALTLFLSSTVFLILINNINFICNYEFILIIIGYSLIIDNK